MLYISTKFCEIISNGIKVGLNSILLINRHIQQDKDIYGTGSDSIKRYQSYRADTIFIWKITKENNYAKYIDGVIVVNLCTSSGHALYFYQVL